MKKLKLTISVLLLSSISFVSLAQNNESGSITCEQFAFTKPLREILEENPVNIKKVIRQHKKEHAEESDKRGKYRKSQNFEFNTKDFGLAYGNDSSLFQTQNGSRTPQKTLVNVLGQAAQSYPHDTSGAAGLQH